MNNQFDKLLYQFVELIEIYFLLHVLFSFLYILTQTIMHLVFTDYCKAALGNVRLCLTLIRIS